jgi:aspartate aminotransferase
MALSAAESDGRHPGCLIVTLPDNPTGALAEESLVEAGCAIADRHGLAVISDEIYRELAYEPLSFRSPSHFLPERTVVTTGLSKSLALGGWRIGAARFPTGASGERIRRDVTALASELWSSLAGPMQAVAAHLFGESATVSAHVSASRQLHRSVALEVHRLFLAAGAECRTPQAAFYLYPDFAALREPLRSIGIASGDQLAEYLLRERGVAVLAGSAFGDEPAALQFRVATSLLYGQTDDQRWAALRSTSPSDLPWIADSLTQLREGLKPLQSLSSGSSTPS